MSEAGRPPAADAPIGAIVLAAGGSSRLGRPKQLIEYGGVALVRRAVLTAIEARLLPVVVLGCEADACRGRIADLSALVVVNEGWERGIGSSLRLGAEHLRRETAVNAAVVMLCDQPLVDAAVLGRIVSTYRCGAAVVAARYAGTLGVPALFSGAWLGRLAGLADDAGAKGVIREAGAAAVGVDVPEAAMDVDSEADLRRLTGEKLTQRRGGAEEGD